MSDSLIWLTPDDPQDTLLVVGRGSVYIAFAKSGELDTAHDMLRSGSDPERVLPNSRLRIKKEQLRQVKHQRDSGWIKFCYVDDKQKQRTYDYPVGGLKPAADAARAIAAEMNLSITPREETASLFDISWLPASFAVGALSVLGLTYLAAINSGPDSPEPTSRRARAAQAVAELLGPQGLLAVMGLVALATVGYCCYRFVQGPVVDVYHAGDA